MGSIGPDPATSSKHVIPTIDMSAWLDENGSSPAALDAVVKEVSDACRAFGFFQLVGHGIPFEMQSEVFACAQRFFEMPLNEKMGVSIKKAMGLANRGYEAFQGQSLQVGGLPDLKEGYFVGEEIPTDSPRAGKFLQGPNQWPASLPEDKFEAPLQRYRNKMVQLAQRVLRILACGLPSPPAAPNMFDEFMIQPSGNLRLLHYPPQTSQDEGLMGAGAHTDFGGITFLLQQPGTSGLEVLYPPTDSWIPVPVQAGSYVVNIGDLLEMWTAGYYRSAEHRVKNIGANHRFSAPFFYNGNVNLQITPLDFVDTVASVEKEVITVEQHIRGKLLATHEKAM